MRVKKYSIIFCMLFLGLCVLSAKPRAASSGSLKNGFSLHVGGVFTNLKNLNKHNTERTTVSFGTGGLNIALQYGIGKNFGVYGLADFTFGSRLYQSKSSRSYNRYTYTAVKYPAELTYVIDSQLGFYYLFHAPANVHFMLGLGLGIGGNGYHIKDSQHVEKKQITNIGAGVNFDVLYMFTKMIGIYGGVSDTMYAPVAVKIREESLKNGSSSTTHYNGSDIQRKAGVGSFSNSFNLKVGLRFSL